MFAALRELWLRRCGVAACAMMLTACVLAPLDPFPAARRAIDEGDLLRAMAHLDQIAPAHPDAAQAHLLRALVEGRIADCQRLVVQGLRLQVAGREGDAIAALQRARELWPRAVGVADLLAGVPQSPADESPSLQVTVLQERQPVTEETPSGATAPVAAAAPAADAEPPRVPEVPAAAFVVAEPPASAAPSAPTLAPGTRSDATMADVRRPAGVASATAAPTPAGSTDGARPLDLPALRALAQGRDQTRAISYLTDAHKHHPENLEVRVLLAGLLRQRALVAYGRGWLESAIEDWTRITRLTPDDHACADHLRMARAERAQRHEDAAKKKNAGG